jgi:multidrug efflux pump
VAAATLVLTILLFIAIPKGFFPIQDTGVIQGISEAAQTASFQEMSRMQQELVKIIRKDPAVDSLSSFIGIDGTNVTMNSGRILINLKSLDVRTETASEVIRRLQPKLADVTGITLFMQPVQDLTVEDRVSRTQFQYTVEDPNTDELNDFAPKLLGKLRSLPELRDAASDQQVQGLRAYLNVDRDTAARLGITTSAIDQTLYDAFGQRLVSIMFTQLNQYHVVLEVKPDFQRGPSDIQKLYIRTGAGGATSLTGVVAGGSSGGGRGGAGTTPGSATAATTTSTSVPGPRQVMPTSSSLAVTSAFSAPASTPAASNFTQVPLRAFSRMQMMAAPITINHQGQFPVITFSFNLAPGGSLGDAVKAVDRAVAELNPPASMQTAFQGSAAAFQSSLANEWVLILAALVTVYIVLGVLYESYIHPLTILSTLPSAGVGALLALEVTGSDFSVIALIGLVLLIGIVKKNAIMMIDFALDAEREQGHTPLEAIHQACLLRFRPIMMTTMAALLGAVPLAIGGGTGSELRKPLGIAIIGGLMISQLLTLYTTPVIYLWFDRLARHFKRPPTGPSPQLSE